jgi:hypothetical protein
MKKAFLFLGLIVMWVIIHYGLTHQPLTPRPVNQALFDQLLTLESADLLVEKSGDVNVVVMVTSVEHVMLRNTHSREFEIRIDEIASQKDPPRIVRKFGSGWNECAAAFIRKIRCVQ